MALPSEEGVYRHAQFIRDSGQQGHVRRAAVLPPADGLGRDPHRLTQLLLGHVQSLSVLRDLLTNSDMGYMEKCELKDEESGDCVLATSMVWLDGGIMLNLHSDEMSFASVWPMPEAGYEAFFAPGDDYRRLSELVKPVLYGHSRQPPGHGVVDVHLFAALPSEEGVYRHAQFIRFAPEAQTVWSELTAVRSAGLLRLFRRG